jgi:hypothetical protein
MVVFQEKLTVSFTLEPRMKALKTGRSRKDKEKNEHEDDEQHQNIYKN